ncbi:MAG: extracellular solute-binding protein [Beutenbergiaceae bacterium]
MTWEHARGYDSVVAAAQAYRSVQPDVEIRWEYRSLLAFGDQGLNEFVADYDLVVIDHPHIPIAAEQGWLLPLDGSGHDDELALLAQQSVGPSHATYRYNGHQWGLATDAAAQVAAWRPDLLPEPPRTWDQVLELASQGRVLWPAKPVDAFSTMVTIAGAHGHAAMAEPGRFLPRDVGRATLELMHRLMASVPEDNLGLNPIEVSDLLASGDQYAYCPLLFGYTNYSRPGFRRHRLAYIDVPAGPAGNDGSLLGGAGIAVSARTQHPEEAIAHAIWLDSAAVQEGVYFDGGGQPGNAVAWESDRTNAATLDFFRNTRHTLETAYVRPRHVAYMDVQNAAGTLINATLRREYSDDDLLTQLDYLVGQHLGGSRADG